MLRIACRTSVDAVEAFLLKARGHIMDSMKKALAQLIRDCDARARNRGYDESFRDVTGNLRSSLGGAVYEHGVIYFTTAFATVLNGARGSAEGRRLVSELAHQYANTVAAVYVAAMDYAEKVEAIDSKDVIESTRLWAESEVQKRLEAAKERAIKDINSWRI